MTEILRAAQRGEWIEVRGATTLPGERTPRVVVAEVHASEVRRRGDEALRRAIETTARYLASGEGSGV